MLHVALCIAAQHRRCLAADAPMRCVHEALVCAATVPAGDAAAEPGSTAQCRPFCFPWASLIRASLFSLAFPCLPRPCVTGIASGELEITVIRSNWFTQHSNPQMDSMLNAAFFCMEHGALFAQRLTLNPFF